MDALFFDASLFSGVWTGLAAVLSQPSLWGLVLCGVFLGMAVGVLPGFGPPAAMALLFPLVYVLDPLPGIAMLAGIFYGAKYGGAVTSILLGIPGEPDAVATLFEGHPLALAGKARQALAAATLASFAGAMLAAMGLVLLAPVLSGAALLLGPAGRAAAMGAALLLVACTSRGGIRKSLCMIALGFVLASVGPDPVYGTARLSFGLWQFGDGIDITALLLGIFGLGDLLDALLSPPEKTATADACAPVPPDRRAVCAALRGSGVGFLAGLFPCGAGVTASFASHALERRLSRRPERFGHGAWEGLTGPEAANSAAAIASFAPLLLLGLPVNPIMAAMLGALTVGGVVPGPMLPAQQPDFWWGLVFCLLLGNLFLLGLGLGLSRLWAALARAPFRLLWPCLLLLCLLGSWIGADGMSGPVQCLAFGLLAAALKRGGFPPAPLVLAFVLGPRLETHLIQTLLGLF